MSAILLCVAIITVALTYAEAPPTKKSSYSPVVITEDFESTMAKMKAAKPEVMNARWIY